jgi:hypothetical protein
LILIPTFFKNPMKISGSNPTRAILIALGFSAAAVTPAFTQVGRPKSAFIFENYDKNPTGRVFPDISAISTTATTTGGYGVSGRYTSGGRAYDDAFLIEEGSLQFGNLKPTTAGKKLKANAFNSEATAMFVMIDGGRAAGDLLYYYSSVYSSYLVRFTNISNSGSARAEVRIGGNSSSAFEMHADGPATPNSSSIAQPRLGYQFNGMRSSPNPASQGLAPNNTYLMVGRFTQVGNYLGASGTFTWELGSRRLVLPSTATAFPNGLEVGHLIEGPAGAGIPDNTIVTGLETTTAGGVVTRAVLINQNTTAAATSPVSLDTTIIAQDVFTSFARTTAGSPTLTNLPTGHKLAVGQVITHTNIPPGTTITATTANGATMSNNAITTVTSDITVTVRNPNPVRSTFASGLSTITVDRVPVLIDNTNTIDAIKVGNLVEGPGIAEGTLVTGVDKSTKTISLSKATISPQTSVGVRFYSRYATADMWALSEAQYANFMAAGGLDSVLNAATIGTAANQVTTKISRIQTVGSWEFNQGKRVEIVAHGSVSSPQTFHIDEIRYGWNLQAVTENNPYLTPPVSEPNTAGDDMNPVFYETNDSGFGWKSGWYEVEETAATPGANVSIQNIEGVELAPGSGSYLQIFHKSDVSSDQGTRRRPDPAVVDMTQPYTVKFDYRTLSETGLTSFADRIQIGADGPSGVGSNLGPNPGESNNITWLVGVVAGNDTNRVLDKDVVYLADGVTPNPNINAKIININSVPHWYFFDFDPANFITPGSPNYFVPRNMQTSGVPYLAGKTYRFQIEVNPLTYTYKATVTNINDNITGTVENLRFRRQMPAHTLFWGISKPGSPTAPKHRTVGLDNLRVSQGVPYIDPFPSWVSNFPGVPAGYTGRNADANGDGRVNFLDFALDGNPMSGARNSKEIHAISNVGGTNYYTLTIPVRSGATFSATGGPSVSTQVDGITYRIQGSYDLSNWTTGPEVVPLATPLATTPTLTSGWEYKSFRLAAPTSAQPKAFMRAVVENAVAP